MKYWVDGQLYVNGTYFTCSGQFIESDDVWFEDGWICINRQYTFLSNLLGHDTNELGLWNWRGR